MTQPHPHPPYEMHDAYILTKEKWLELCEHLTIGCTNQKAFLDSLATHTPAEPATDKFCDYQDTCARTTSSDCTYCDEAYSNKWKEHNATIRKAEREQVLDKKNIAIIRKGCLHPYWETCGGLNCCQHFVEKTGDCLFDVDAFIESLRGGGAP
jgi:hypothetical protein